MVSNSCGKKKSESKRKNEQLFAITFPICPVTQLRILQIDYRDWMLFCNLDVVL